MALSWVSRSARPDWFPCTQWPTPCPRHAWPGECFTVVVVVFFHFYRSDRIKQTKASAYRRLICKHSVSGIRLIPAFGDRLVGLVVKASASRAEDPGFESGLRRDFSGVESY